MKQNFPRCTMRYDKDENGKEILLKDGKFQVMMEWEKPYMEACIDALKPFGDVLEVGFGLGYSADRIQSFHPKSHTIIEFHPEVAKKAREWAKSYPHVAIIEDTWQNALRDLGVFDCIFFDDYPLESEEEIQKMQSESRASHLLLEKGKSVIQGVEKQIPFLLEIQYSDAEILALMREIPSKDKQTHLHFLHFLEELCQRNQISQKQLQRARDALIEQHRLNADEIAAFLEKSAKKGSSNAKTGDRFFVFLKECLKAHMRKGSRLSCFLSSAISKYEDENFINEIIANPFVEFQENEITLDVPSNCEYFKGNKALVITITKM